MESDTEYTDDFSSIFDDSAFISKRDTVNISEEEAREYFASKDLARSLYNLLNCVHKIFLHHQITYWLCGGSLLGVCRHQGLIPWDDDLDICCLVEQRQQIYELKDIFSKNGYVIEFDESEAKRSAGFSMQIYKEGAFHYTDDNIKTPYPFLDIFFMTDDFGEKEFYEDSVLHFASAMHRSLYKLHYFTLNELYPLKVVDFGPVKEVFVPNNAVSHLSRAYGESCFNEGQIHFYDHKTKQYKGGPVKKFLIKNLRYVDLLEDGFKLAEIIL